MGTAKNNEPKSTQKTYLLKLNHLSQNEVKMF